MTDTSAKKDTQKLQRAIVDALEDVKAQEIVVFDTEAMSPLFERVIIASGTSNRQTKALAASVRDKVREAGYPKPRIEGEDNGEWIIVDCGSAVAHIMQPTIRSYYNLEEIWGDKPVRLKLGAPKPVEPVRKPVAKKKATVSAGRTPTRRDAVPVGPKGSESVRAARPTQAKAPAKSSAKAPVKAPVKAPTKSTAKPSAKAPVKSTNAKVGAKMVSKSAPTTATKAKPVAKPQAKALANPKAKTKG
jgi:ribosome-associated protein